MGLLREIICLSAVSLCASAQLQIPVQEVLDVDVSAKHLSLTHDLLGFHKNLTQIESISGNEKEVGEWLTSSLQSQGYNVEKQVVEKDPLRFNVFAWLGSGKNVSLLMSSHIDTVPPFYPYKRNSSSISGRGSVDAKGSVAAQVIAVNNLISSGKLEPDGVGLLYVVGEEVGGEGMRKANDLELYPKTVIFGEPTEGKLVAGHKGGTSVLIKAKGKAAHSGYPWLGRSANEVLVSVLAALIKLEGRLPKSDKYGATTINLGRIEGGVAANVVAESAEAKLMIRIADGTPEFIHEEVVKSIHHAVRDFLEGEMEPEDVVDIKFLGAGYGPVDIDADVPGFEVITVNYGTDVPWLNKTVEDQKRYLYGPGSILVAHSDHEALTESQLWEAVHGYERIILHAIGKK